jgi:DNA polymerase-3 subunit epsilon
MSRKIFLDTETTGLDPSKGHRLIEIGAMEMINRRLTGKNFHVYLNPERAVDPGALAIHGLNDAFLAEKPKFQTVITDLLDYLQGAELIIHNAAFDLGFLEHELRLANAPVQQIRDLCEVTDTLAMARKMHPGQKNSLDALCKRYSIDNSHRTLHGALLDAQILSHVYLAMTGGQASLLSDTFHNTPAEKIPTSKEKTLTDKTLAAFNYPIHQANTEELSAHQSCLALLNKKSKGQCLWINLEDNELHEKISH